MAVDDGLGDVDEFSSVPLRVRAKEFERSLLVDRVRHHQDAFRLFDLGGVDEFSSVPLEAVVDSHKLLLPKPVEHSPGSSPAA